MRLLRVVEDLGPNSNAMLCNGKEENKTLLQKQVSKDDEEVVA